MKFKYLIILASLFVIGCTSDLFPGGQPIPQETTSELMILGSSLGSLRRGDSSLPNDIGAAIDSERPGFVYAGDLSITFVPPESDQQSIDIDRGTFLYAFSEQIGDEFVLLTNPKFSGSGEQPERIFIELFRDVSLLDNESLADLADFYLTSNVFYVPFNATHLELSYAASENTDPINIERWELTRFYGYNRYLRPLIDGS